MPDPHPPPAAGATNGREPVVLRPAPDATLRSHDAWLAAEIPRPPPLVDGLLGAATAAYWSGPASSLKTWCELHAARAIAAGRPFLGRFATTPGPVLVIDAESHDAGLHERLRLLDEADPLPPGAPLHLATVAGLYLNGPAGWARVDGWLRELRPVAVFVDSSVRVNLGDENSAGGMADFHATVRAWVREYGAAFVLLDHVRKKGLINDPEERQRGSGDKRAFVDAALDFEPGKGRPPTAILTPHKNRWGALPPPFVVRLEVDGAAGTARLTHQGEARTDQASRQHEVLAAVAALKAQHGADAADARAVAFWLERSDDTAKRHLDKAVKAGLLRTRSATGTGGRPPTVYDLVERGDG